MKRDTAQMSDQVRTREEELDGILKVFVKVAWRPLLIDVCLYRPYWHKDYYWDATKEPWGGGLVFCNPPFSMAWVFVFKAFWEWLKGCSVLLLVPVRKFNAALEALVKLLQLDIGVLSKCYVEVPMAENRFKGHDDVMQEQCHWYLFLQEGVARTPEER